MGRTFTVEHHEDLTIPEDEFFDAKLDEITYRTINWKDKNTGQDREAEKASFWFKITTPGKYEGRKVRGECDAELSNRRPQMLEWCSVISNRELTVDSELDMDELPGRRVSLTVKHVRGFKDPSRIFEEVDVLLPAREDSYVAPPF